MALNPVHTIGDQIAEAVRLHLGGTHAQATERAVELLRLVRVPAPERRVRDYPHNLSGGMRQRAMIAMALACSPKLLVADEPTTALDVTIQAQVLELVRELKEQLHMAMLLITHDLGVVAEAAGRVVVMYAGRKVEEGAVRDVFREPRHPYTEGLIKVSRWESSGGLEMPEIPGTVLPRTSCPLDVVSSRDAALHCRRAVGTSRRFSNWRKGDHPHVFSPRRTGREPRRPPGR